MLTATHNRRLSNCTDYFGSGNWANSPLPAGTITGYTLIAGGSGYTAPTVTVTDPTGAPLTGASAPTPIVVSGVITGFTGGTGGTNYTAPVITIMDATGSGALASATLGPPFVGGVHKFVDAFKSLPLAVPDTTTFPGSDYYEIALVQYTQKMHTRPASDHAARLRAGQQRHGAAREQYSRAACSVLSGPGDPRPEGPAGARQVHELPPTGAGGNLFIPMDTTYMGAGTRPYTQNRATLHLHGGATPWISDGTPHQWTVPAGETSLRRATAWRTSPTCGSTAAGDT